MTRVPCLLRQNALLLVVAALMVGSPVQAQWSAQTRDHRNVLEAYKSALSSPAVSVVRVMSNGADVALGTVVDAEGWIITKASLLKDRIVCRFKDGSTKAAKIVGIHEDHDLAMLKIDGVKLLPISWRNSVEPAEIGDMVASPDMDGRAVTVGVVSVAVRKPHAREMPKSSPSPTGGYLGIGLDEGKNGEVVIGMVEPNGPAAKAGLKVRDAVLSVAGRKVPSPDQLVAAIQSYRPGQTIKLKIRRGDEEKEIEATLARRPRESTRGDEMNRMGSTLSDRRGGFPIILTSDQVIKPGDCGGPMVDLEGKALGINIARGGRTESFAIPSEVVQSLISDFKAGKYAPKVDYEAKVASLEAELAPLERKVIKLEADPKADEKVIKQLNDQIETLRKELDAAKAELEKVDATKKSK
jgi:serine protease Do